MKTIGGITFNESMITKERFSSNDMKILKSFFGEGFTKIAILNNDFGIVFDLWSKSNPSYLPKVLIEFLLLADVDFLSHMKTIPNKFFENCSWLERIEIPENIEEIGWGSFSYTNIKEIKVKNRNKQLYISVTAFDKMNDVNGAAYNNVTSFIFEGTKKEFDDYMICNGGPGPVFMCKDGATRL